MVRSFLVMKAWNRKCMKNLYPHHIRIPYEEWNVFLKFKQLSRSTKHHAFLESGRGGRYHIIGLQPIEVVTAKNNSITIENEHGTSEKKGPVFSLLQQYMQQWTAEKVEELPDFQGGLIGFFSYDCAREIEKLPHTADDDLHTPDYMLMNFKEVFLFDKETNEFIIIVLDEKENRANAMERCNKWVQKWLEPVEDVHLEWDEVANDVPVSMTEDVFSEAVERIREYIAAGDVFQVNLSVRQSVTIKVHPLAVYETLRTINPSPYMSYIQWGNSFIVSGSPELLVKNSSGKLSTRPIAGTRSRGKDEEEDVRLADELISNEKERAEHVMLVDLERNDLGKVSQYGTVKVDEFMVIERYSHVMHIVSNVIGEMRKDVTNVDVIRAVFPGGTITGAPKVRTLEIIEELEPVRRGIYTGAIGWLSWTGDMELNIVIRTLVVAEHKGFIQAGAGIVIDSVPRHEYKESLKKARAMLVAVQQANEEGGMK